MHSPSTQSFVEARQFLLSQRGRLDALAGTAQESPMTWMVGIAVA